MVTEQEKTNNFKNTVIIMEFVIIVGLSLLCYCNNIIYTNVLTECVLIDNNKKISLYDGNYKHLNITEINNIIMIDETPLENDTLAERNSTFINQS